MPSGVKRYRVRLKAEDSVGLKRALGHRLRPDGMRMALPVLPPVDTAVEVLICYPDERIALSGSGWVASLDEGEVELELEWQDGVEPGLATWLFGQEEPAARPVRLDDLDSPDEVPLRAPSGVAPGPKLHPDLEWELDRPIPDEHAELEDDPFALPPWASFDASEETPTIEPPTQPLWVDTATPSIYDEQTPIALTDVVEQAQTDVDAQDSREPVSVRIEAPAELAEESRRREAANLVPGDPWREEVAAPPRSARAQSLFSSILEADETPTPTAEALFELRSSPGSSPHESREVTPLARIELVQKDVSALDVYEPPPLLSDEEEMEPLPDLAHPPSLARPVGPILALDLGTSMTVAAVAEQEMPARTLRAETGADSLPSVVVFEPDGRVLAGAPALRALAARPNCGVVGAKRLLGRSYWSPVVRRVESQLTWLPVSGVLGQVAANVGGREAALEEVVALLLRRAVRAATDDLGASANRVILACPAYYGARQRAALVTAARLAGLHVEQVISCCLATAIHHVLDRELSRHRLLVFDLGAGTLDVAVVEVDGNRLTSLAAGGHAVLGGLDFDAAVAQLLIRALEGTGSAPEGTEAAMTGMLDAAEGGKQALGEISKVQLPVSAAVARQAADDVSVVIARDEAEGLWAGLVDKALSITRDVCRRAGVAPMEIDEVILTGGQVQAPYVQRRLSEFFRRPCVLAEERASVALGAAEVGRHSENGLPRFRVRESLPSSLCIGSVGGGVQVLVRRDSKLPGAGEARIHLPPRAPPELLLYEGDHVRVEGCEPYGRVRLSAIPETREDELALEVHAHVDTFGRVRLDVLRASNRTSVPYQLDPVLPTELAAKVLAAPVLEEPVAAETGFMDWLKKKLLG